MPKPQMHYKDVSATNSINMSNSPFSWWIEGFGGNDAIVGSKFDDQLFGDAGDDVIYGGLGDDYISGGSNNDVLKGGGGSDELWGGTGNDTLFGGAGKDTLVGEQGVDTFYFYKGDAVFDGNKPTDWIVDFGWDADVIDLRGYGGGEGKGLKVVESFSGKGNELTITHQSWGTFDVAYISIDLDGDMKIDEQIGVRYGNIGVTLDSSDLLL